MKLIKSSYEIWEQPFGLEGIYKQIEKAGRTCYKSEDKITENSSKEFVNRMIKSGHGAMLEHGTVYLKSSHYTGGIGTGPIGCVKYIDNPYSVCNIIDDTMYVTTNYRVLIEHNWLNDLQYICEPTEFHEKRITVYFVCDRGISHEFVRHKLLCVA